MTDFKKIKALLFDVDGVLTDGSVWVIHGDQIRCFNEKDSLALKLASVQGLRLGIVTGGISTTIVEKVARFGIEPDDVYLNSIFKMEKVNDFCKRHNLDLSEIIYSGDDLPDIPPIKAAGIGACPADAVKDVRDAADFVSNFNGGKGFVRDLIEQVLKAQGLWFTDIEKYRK